MLLKERRLQGCHYLVLSSMTCLMQTDLQYQYHQFMLVCELASRDGAWLESKYLIFPIPKISLWYLV